MNKADEKQLEGLHGQVAKVLNSQISETMVIKDEETGEEQEVFTATPATVTAAIRFLKDNDVTASIEDDDNLSELKGQLQEKRERRKLRVVEK